MSMIKFYPSTCQPRIQLEGAVEKRDGCLLIRFGELLNLLGPEQIIIIGIQVFWPLTLGCRPPGFLNQPHAAAETVGDLLGDLGLNGEHIFNRPVPTADQRWLPVFASISCDVIRTWSPCRWIEPSST